MIREKRKGRYLIMKKKFIGTIAALSLSLMCLLPLPVMAATEPYNWTFHSTQGNLPTNSGKKNDTEQNYYLSINSGNISSANIFGARIRQAGNNAAMSPYVTHTSLKKSARYAYSSAVNTSTLYFMRGKKDDTSTTTTSLQVAGKVTY